MSYKQRKKEFNWQLKLIVMDDKLDSFSRLSEMEKLFASRIWYHKLLDFIEDEILTLFKRNAK